MRISAKPSFSQVYQSVFLIHRLTAYREGFCYGYCKRLSLQLEKQKNCQIDGAWILTSTFICHLQLVDEKSKLPRLIFPEGRGSRII